MATPHDPLPPPPPLDFANVLSESKLIINAHSRHFLALSVLFLLPLSFSITIFPTLHQTLSLRPDQSLLRFSHSTTTAVSLIIAIPYLLFISFLSLCAVGSVTFSVFHGFYGRPVKLISAIKSLYKSLLPLLMTSALSNLAILVSCFIFGLLVFSILGVIRYLGFQISHTSPYFISFCMVCIVGLVLVLVYLQVNWALACVVVVVESTSGIDPLRRSTSLVKGMRRLSLALVLFFGFSIGMLMWISLCTWPNLSITGSSNGWKSVAFIVQIVVTSALVSLLMLHNLAAITVFYMYCKAMQGELAAEIAEEFAREYVSLPFDAEKVPHIVSVI